jgi:hypothetical protein
VKNGNTVLVWKPSTRSKPSFLLSSFRGGKGQGRKEDLIFIWKFRTSHEKHMFCSPQQFRSIKKCPKTTFDSPKELIIQALKKKRWIQKPRKWANP